MFTKKEQTVLLLLISIVVAGIVIILFRDYRVPGKLEASSYVEVFICGEVLHPGLYRIQCRDTFKKIFTSAGISRGAGGIVEVDVLDSEEEIFLPVNINKATLQEIESLPGIGPKLAMAIISWRKKNGPFKEKIQLRNIKGIGVKKYAQIVDLIQMEEKESGVVPDKLKFIIPEEKVTGEIDIDSSFMILLEKVQFSEQNLVSKTQRTEGIPLRLKMELK